MAGRLGDFNKKITNTRNSNDDFQVNIDEGVNLTKGARRTSAAQLEKSLFKGVGNKQNFTSITPQGLPPDLIGDEAHLVERQNVLIEPKGYKNEAARLPPFKPFKTISDEDNIHLLPGETGERARLNLLDTKAVGKKDVEETRLAYEKQRQQYPELYKKKENFDTLNQNINVELPPTQDEDEPPPLPAEEPLEEEMPTPEKKPSSSKDKSQRKSSQPKPPPSPSESESSEESSDSDEDQWGYGGMPYYGYYPQYPGMPGGYSPYFNQAYGNGYGPMQMPPGYNACMEDIQMECCKKLLKANKRHHHHRRKGEGDESRSVSSYSYASTKVKTKKTQGLNFDFLPHDDLATEVTMIIEPDEPEPLQYAVENGVMPIICCYMPSSLAVQQEPATQTHSMKGHSSAYGTSYGYGRNSSGQKKTSSHPSRKKESNQDGEEKNRTVEDEEKDQSVKYNDDDGEEDKFYLDGIDDD